MEYKISDGFEFVFEIILLFYQDFMIMVKDSFDFGIEFYHGIYQILHVDIRTIEDKLNLLL